MTTLTPKQFARYLDTLPDRLIKNVARAERETVADAHREAVKLSSGTVTTKQLRQADHPYATRAPNAAYDPTIINDHGGGFPQDWEAKTQIITSQRILSGLVNRNPAARYMAGTQIMVRRGIDDAVKERVRIRRMQRLSLATEAALSPLNL